MSFNNESIDDNFIKFGDVKCLSNFIEGDVKCLSNIIEGDVNCLSKYIAKDEYSNELVSEFINEYGSDENVKTPEVEHIKELQNKNENEEVFIVNLNEKSFFRYLKKDETDSGYNKLLLNLLTPPNVNTKISHWMRTDKIVFAPKHLHKYLEQTYNELGKTAF